MTAFYIDGGHAEEESLATLRRALDQGMLVDTADAYRSTASSNEELIGVHESWTERSGLAVRALQQLPLGALAVPHAARAPSHQARRQLLASAAGRSGGIGMQLSWRQQTYHTQPSAGESCQSMCIEMWHATLLLSDLLCVYTGLCCTLPFCRRRRQGPEGKAAGYCGCGHQVRLHTCQRPDDRLRQASICAVSEPIPQGCPTHIISNQVSRGSYYHGRS